MSRLVGRERELSTLRAEVAVALAGRPRLLVVEGPAGIGKTRLIGAFVGERSDLLVRHALADEVESTARFGVLDQLFGGEVATLVPGTHPVAAGARMLDVIGRMQDHGCLLLVIDDAHWADLPSLHAVLFCFRRLQVDRVLVLLAVRSEDAHRIPDGVERVLAAGRGRRVQLAGLDVDAIAEVARRAGCAHLSRAQLRRVTEHTGGNPLYATALLTEVEPEELRASGLPLPAPRLLARATRARLARVSQPARQLVTAVAVLGGAAPLPVAARVGAVTDAARALDEAVECGLLARHGAPPATTVRPAHPLIGAAVYQELPAAEQARLHQVAAAAGLDEATSLRHRLAACAAPDENLAAEAANYAHREARRGAVGQAASALVGAARVAERVPTRERLLLDAAELCLFAADVSTATDLAADIDAFAPSARRDWVRGWLALLSGSFGSAEDLLVTAWHQTYGTDRELRRQIAVRLAYLYMNRAQGDRFAKWSQRAIANGQVPDTTGVETGIMAVGLFLCGKYNEAQALVAAAGSDQLRPEQMGPTLARGALRLLADDLHGAREDLTAVTDACRRNGTSLLLIHALGFLSEAEFRAGLWDDAQMHAELAVSLASDGDVTQLAAPLHAFAAQVPARRGDFDQATAHLQPAWAAAVAPGNVSGLAYAATAAAILAHANGDHAEVIAATDKLSPLAGLVGAHEPALLRWQELRVEALTTLGRLSEAKELLSSLARRIADRESHSVRANAARVRGYLEATRGRPEQAVDAFEHALEHAAMVDVPFERAMIHLQYGAHLRRTGQRRAAAESLQMADKIFRRLAARPFVDMAGRELAGCGLGRSHRVGPGPLTPQERTVARLVSTGKSNREVARELFISTKTVEYHLGNIYTKLGLRSRGQLIAHIHTSNR